jgi:hypothetical protein
MDGQTDKHTHRQTDWQAGRKEGRRTDVADYFSAFGIQKLDSLLKKQYTYPLDTTSRPVAVAESIEHWTSG